MDEKLSAINPGDSLPASDNVYRLVMITARDKKNKQIPAIRCFSLSEADQGKLSVDWNRLTTPEECIARVGASYKTGTTSFKDHTEREIYAINIEFLLSLEGICNVVYDPIKNSPIEKGKPNNPAHSLVIFDISPEDAPEVYLKIRDHAKEQRVKCNMQMIGDLVNNYRNQE